MREALVHTERARDGTPAAPDCLGDERHLRNHRTRLDERVRRGYLPRRGGCYDSEEDQSPSPEPPGLRAFSWAIRRAPFPARFRAPTTITKYSGETRPKLWLTGWPASWEERTTTTSSSTTSPCSSPTLPGPGWSICLPRRSPTGTTWSRPSLETSKVRMCALGTPGISEAAASNQGIPARVHPTVFKAAHRAAQHHRLRRHRRVPRQHHVPRPGEQIGAQDSHQGERIDGHRHQVRLW
jgi:hypothetical protein